MLDDLKYIHDRDAQDALGIASKQYGQLVYDFHVDGNSRFGTIANVVWAGMGGSALGGLLVRSWPQLDKPFEIVREYNLPPYVGPDSLVVLSSYSGNTEETLQALAQAEERGAQIAVLASGGKLWELAVAKDYARVQLPDTGQPRYAVFYSYRASIELFRAAGVLKTDVSADLEAASALLQRSAAAWLPTVPVKDNPAKQLALELIGKSIVVYAGPKLAPAAYKWKISFNENAKHVAWWNTYPEFNHNEFIGWSKQPVDKPYAVIDLRGSCEDERVLKRFEISARLLSGVRPEPHVVTAEGETTVQQLLWTVVFGDFVSLYVALLNGLNPAPVELVEKLKLELAK
jgi:glucose/mannose-6-phosphate isomerase